MFRNFNADFLDVSSSQREVIELALSYQFKSLDLDMAQFAEQVDSEGLPAARRLIDSARMSIGTFRLPLAWQQWEEEERQYKQGLERLPKLAEYATQMGCTRCVTVVEPASDERPYQENFEFHRKRLGEIADILGPRDIRLGLELDATPAHRQGCAFQFLHTFDAVALLAKMTPADNVGVVVDAWQMHIAGGGLDEVRSLSPEEIVAVYLSDCPPEANLEQIDESARLMPGETGVIDTAGLLVVLAELGYDGPVSPRFSPESVAGKSRHEKVKLAAERLAEHWKQAGLNAKGKLKAAAES